MGEHWPRQGWVPWNGLLRAHTAGLLGVLTHTIQGCYVHTHSEGLLDVPMHRVQGWKLHTHRVQVHRY